MSANQRMVAKTNRYRVHRGEPGQDIATELKDGYPVIENPPVALASQSLPSVPSLIEDQSEGKPVTLSLYDEIARWRASLILAFNEEASNRTGLKRERFSRFLKGYNSGSLLPNIYKKLGPISDKTLYRWRKDFAAQGVDGLVPQYGGAGQSKISDHEKNVLLALWLHPSRLNVAKTIMETKRRLKKMGIESPSSPSTLRRFVDEFRKEHNGICVLYREGEKALNDKVLPYAERDWSMVKVGDGLIADGHRLNFQVIHPTTGKPCRPMLVLFVDGRSSYPLGWEIMLEENVQCVTSAFRNAILALGKFPRWVYLDNGKAFKAKTFTEDLSFEDTELPGMFGRLSQEAGHPVNYHFAKPYNAQAKPIERIFRTLNEEFERVMPSYIGNSINDKPAWTKRNEKFARSLQDPYVPTIREANDAIRAWRDDYAERPSRGRDGFRPIDIFNEGKGPGVDPAKLFYLMMEREIKTVHRNGITWLGWHWFDEDLCGLKDKVVIRYSLSDLSQIYVFHKNEFRCVAKPVEKVHPMASESEDPRDMETVKNFFRLRNSVERGIRKVCHQVKSKGAEQIDWSRGRHPEILEVIQKIEVEKKPKTVKISPFDGVPYNDLPQPVPEEGGVDTPTDDPSRLSCPRFREGYEMYDWYYVNDIEKYKIIDLGWIDWYEDGYMGKHLKDESEQANLKYQLSRRSVKSEHDGDAENGQDERKDYRLGRDPAIERRWRDIKDSIIVDPASGLSRPEEEIPSDDKRTWYGFYRGIERRFRGTLIDGDWKEVKKYEESREWESVFHEYECFRLERAEDE